MQFNDIPLFSCKNMLLFYANVYRQSEFNTYIILYNTSGSMYSMSLYMLCLFKINTLIINIIISYNFHLLRYLERQNMDTKGDFRIQKLWGQSVVNRRNSLFIHYNITNLTGQCQTN